MNYSQKIKELRAASGLTQEQLADKLCVKRQTVSKWEQAINEPDIETIKKLAEIFGVTTDEIMGAASAETVLELKQPRLQRACKALTSVSSLLDAFWFVAALIFWNFAPVPSDTLGVSLNLLEEGELSPAAFQMSSDIAMWHRNTLPLLFLPLFAALCGLGIVLFYGAKRYPKAQVTALSIIAAEELGAGIAMTTLTFVLPEEICTTYTLPMILCLAMDMVAVMGAACHPKLLPANQLMGLRTEFTMHNNDAWRKMNTLLSFLTPSCCALFIAIVMATSATNATALLAGQVATLVGIVVPCAICHELLRKKTQRA